MNATTKFPFPVRSLAFLLLAALLMNLGQSVFLFGIPEAQAETYTWKGNGTELNDDFTNTNYWTATSGSNIILNTSAQVSKGSVLTMPGTFVFGNAAKSAMTTSTLTIDGTLNLTANRPVSGNANNNTLIWNVSGTLNATANNFCFGEVGNTKSTLNLYSGGSVTMSGLVGSSGQATVNVVDGSSLRFKNNVIIGWRGGKGDYSWMGLVNQTGGNVTAMTTNRQWTAISGIGISSSANATGSVCPAGQYILSGGSMSTIRFSANDDYDEANYTALTTTHTNTDRSGIYASLGLSTAQIALADKKCFIMTGGQANIVAAAGISASDSASFGTLSVPTLFLDGTLNVQKIDASRMADDTFVQYGGLLSPSGGTWNGTAGVLTVDPNGVTGLTITGNWTQQAGAAQIDIKSASSLDLITVSGAANLSGKLNVIDLTGTASGSASYDILTASSVTTGAGFGIDVSGLYVGSFTSNVGADKISVTVNYGNTANYVWKGGTNAANEFLTRSNWTDGGSETWELVNFCNHTFGDAAHGNAYAKIGSATAAGSASMTMASGTSTAVLDVAEGGSWQVVNTLTMASAAGSSATINVNGTMAAPAFTTGAGSANLNVGTTGTLNLSGDLVLTNGSFTSAGTSSLKNVTIGNGAGTTASLAITNGAFTASALNISKGGSTSSLTIGTAGASGGPTVTVSGLSIAGEGNGAGPATFTLESGTVQVNGIWDVSHAGNSNSTVNLNGGTMTVAEMTRFTESTNSRTTVNLAGTNLTLNKRATWGSHGQTTVNISGGSLTALGQFVLNFYEQNDSVTQTGGTVNLWANSEDGWGVRTNPGFIAGFSNSGIWHGGLQFGNTGSSDTLRNMNGSMTWNISGGELNTYRIFTLAKPTENMLTISGTAQVNVVSNGEAATKYFGILAVPTTMTGGTLNAETIYAQAPYYSSSNVLTEAAHNYMTDGKFAQSGGVLSPDGGSVVSNAFVASATGISSTTIIGNYVLSGTGSVKLDVGAFDADFNAANDSVKIVCAEGTTGGNATIGGEGAKINLSAPLLTDVLAGNYDTKLGTTETTVLLMTASAFTGQTIVALRGWNNQLDGSDYYWGTSVDSYGSDGLSGLYAVLRSTGEACYWDQNAGGWSADPYGALDYYVGSSSVGNSPSATTAVLNQNGILPGAMHVAQDAGTTGKLTIKGNAAVTSLQLNQVGVSGAGELVIDAGSSLTAQFLTLGVETASSGKLTVNGTASINSLAQGKGAANLAVGSTGNLTVTSAYAQNGGSITNAGKLTINGALTLNRETVALTGNSVTKFDYSEGTTRIGYSGASSLTTSGSAQLQFAMRHATDDRYLRFGANSTMNFTEDSKVVLGAGVGNSYENYSIHLGGTTNVSGNSILRVTPRLYFGEDGNTTPAQLNLSGNSKTFTNLFLVSGSGSAALSVSGNAYLNVSGEFCVGYGNTTGTATVNQTGGTVEVWGDGTTRWNKNFGLHFGGNGGVQSAGTYELTNGTLNTFSVRAADAKTATPQTNTTPLLIMRGGEMNVIQKTGSESVTGSIEVPFLFTGGTLNATKIVGYGYERSATWFADHNSGKTANNTFYQFGGTLSPDGGSTEAQTITVGDFGNVSYQTFVPTTSTQGVTTTIEGNYVVDLTDADPTVPVISLDVYSTSDYDKIHVTGDVTIDDSAVLQLLFEDLSSADLSKNYSVLSMDSTKTLTGNFATVELTDLLGETLRFDANAVMLPGQWGTLSFTLAVPEPSSVFLLLFGALGLAGLMRRKNSRIY